MSQMTQSHSGSWCWMLAGLLAGTVNQSSNKLLFCVAWASRSVMVGFVRQHIKKESSKILRGSYNFLCNNMENHEALHDWYIQSIKSKLQKQPKFEGEENREWIRGGVVNCSHLWRQITTTSLYCWWTLCNFSFCPLLLKLLGRLFYITFWKFFVLYFVVQVQLS